MIPFEPRQVQPAPGPREGGEALHASAPPGCKCSDCTIDKEACPTCYSAWWKKRHPSVQFVGGELAAKSEGDETGLSIAELDEIERLYRKAKDEDDPYAIVHPLLTATLSVRLPKLLAMARDNAVLRERIGLYFVKYDEAVEENERLREQLARSQAELRHWFGCPACGERHGADATCPPHEVRVAGQAWFYRALREAKDREERSQAVLAEAVAALRKTADCPDGCKRCREQLSLIVAKHAKPEGQ